MDIERGNLEILFQWIPYEKITLDAINPNERHDCFQVNLQFYLEQCHRVFAKRSEDERKNCYAYLRETMGRKQSYPTSVFQLILDVADKMLDCRADKVFCRFQELLRWREISLHLSQDLFVCAYLADFDLCHGRRRRNFSWHPILISDNSRIHAILRKGIAENHFHLKGSSRIFEVNWICLMNHIDRRENEFGLIRTELQRNGGQEENFGWRLYKKCQKAALYRLYLFCVLCGDIYLRARAERWLEEASLDIFLSQVQAAIEQVAESYGARFHFVNYEGRAEREGDCPQILDYAFLAEFYDSNRTSHRILTGERWFLYKCFRACLCSEFSQYQQNVFYCYLKLRSEFRQEMVQINQEIGFQNFSNYDKRKECFIQRELHPYYWREFIVMAIRDQLDREHLRSLELRIVPKTSAIENYRTLNQYRKLALPRGSDEEMRARYVMHFPKRRDKGAGVSVCGLMTEPRNFEIRRESKKSARALSNLMRSCSSFRTMIVGIDACASEIGCRPEVFGQIFRYLINSNFSVDGMSLAYDREKPPCWLAMTYHVGEDFLDIVDGLRAIDETLLFCGLERGSRIGHGLALGIDPKGYYESKAYCLSLPKQELLDDIAWLLCVADEYGCSVDVCLRAELKSKFQILFQDVYRSFYGENVASLEQQAGMSELDYFMAWKLRGDSPFLYRLSWDEFQEKNRHKGNELECWDRFSFNKNPELPEQLREIPLYVELNRFYAFDAGVRSRGKEMESFKISSDYVDLVRQIQDCMIRKLVRKGIAIETNPSSNYLIGTIQRYDQHPILRFNGRKLGDVHANMSLSVSLNTDDQGVFDTLLENEYALMALAAEKAKDENGESKYDIEDIYEWLDYVREMGLEQTFKKS